MAKEVNKMTFYALISDPVRFGVILGLLPGFILGWSIHGLVSVLNKKKGKGA
jgi:hypothetical protein